MNKKLFECEHVTIEAYTTYDSERFSGVTIRTGDRIIYITPFTKGPYSKPTLSISSQSVNMDDG